MEQKDTMTLDDLARIVQNGFLKIDERLDSMDERLDSMDTRLDSMDGRLDSMDARLDSMDGRLHNLEDTTADIKANLNKKVDKIEYNTLEYRVERLEEAPAI
ncbi:MAG: hypothetical protein WCJ25_04400 [Candidatus Moraniibacteriota bacterium]